MIMSLKVYDGKGRWRNKTVAFRMSPEEDEQLEKGSSAFRSDQTGLYHQTCTEKGNRRSRKSTRV